MTPIHKDSLHVGSLTYTPKTLGKLFFWLIWGDICFMIMEAVVPSILPFQFKKLGVTNATYALIASTIPMMITAVVNPIVSFRSDRYRSKWGRRIPFIIYTLPFLVISMIGVGYSDHISRFIIQHYGHSLHITQRELTIGTIALFVIAFTYFNSFVGSVFWYLFNDVVPEALLARFMSLFRLFSLLSASLYNWYIFKYAENHAAEITLGTGLLYFFGFGMMCFMVKEGEYPPAPAYVDGKVGIGSAVKTFFTECLTLPHYWYVFSASVFVSFSQCCNTFMVFWFLATGLDADHIGKVQAIQNIGIAVLIPFSGWLADKFHPLRVVLAGYVVNIALAIPATLVFIFWHPAPATAFVLWALISIVLQSPAQALLGVFDPPAFMVVFPRSRYGQYCSANAMLRAIAGMLGGVSAGVYLDIITRHVGKNNAYNYIPFWQLAFMIPAAISVLLLYRSWKKYGGDDDYVPPVPCEVIADIMDPRLAENQTAPQGILVPAEHPTSFVDHTNS